MGIFDSEDSEDEVKISPNSGEEEDDSRLKDEVETEIVGGSTKDSSKSRSSGSSRGRGSKQGSRGKQMRERSNSKGKSTFGDDGVSMKDIHRQNERIIELLEELNGDDSNNSKQENEMEGDLNGVL